MKLRQLRGRADKLIAILVGIVLLVVFLYGQKPHPRQVKESFAQPTTVPEVTVSTAETVPTPVFLEGVGTVRSRRQTEIASRILAEIEEIRVQPGDRVQEGDVLVMLDSLDLRTRVEEAEATLRSLDEKHSEARTEFERTRNLFAKEATTKQALDLATFRLAETVARKEAAAKSLEQARVQLSYATIKAPFGGLVYHRAVDPGDLATPGKSLLAVYDPAQLRLEALIEEQHLWKVKIGDKLTVLLDSLAESFVGSVSEIVPAVDPFTRTGTIKIDLPDQKRIKPGMFGRARVRVRVRQAVVIPRDAAVRRGQLEIVFTVRDGDGSRPARARMHLVRFGLPIEPDFSRVEVLSGLAPGTRIIVQGARDLYDGSAVRARTNRKGATPIAPGSTKESNR